MTTETVPDNPRSGMAYATGLKVVADALAGQPEIRDIWICLQTPKGESTEALDALAMALFGRPGASEVGKHKADGTIGPLRVSLTQQVPDERDAEIERLKAELAATRGASCLQVLGNGVRCNEPLKRHSLGYWVHADQSTDADDDHSGVGPS